MTILAPYEQAHPAEFPGLLTGDEARRMALFDLEADPGEQRDLSASEPAQVERLRAVFDEMAKQVTAAGKGREDE